MTPPDPLDDDLEDFELDLPPLEADLDAEEEFGAPGLEDETESLIPPAPEKVGLDDQVADDSALDLDGFFEDESAEEGERWTADTEAAGEEIEQDAIGFGQEYGWTEGTEAADVDLDHDFGDETPILGDDLGEEGLEELNVLGDAGDDDAVNLPPIRGALDEDEDAAAEDLDLSGDGEVDLDTFSFEEEARLSGTSLPAPIAETRVRIAHLGPSDDAIVGLAERDGVLLAVGDDAYRLDGDRLVALDAPALAAHTFTSIAAASPTRFVLGTRLGGALRTDDGGATFVARNAWATGDAPTVSFEVILEQPERLWGRARSGALHRSEDLGDRWSSPVLTEPVVSMTVDAAGGLVALSTPRRGPCRLLRASGDGRAFSAVEVPALSPGSAEDVIYLAAHGPFVAITRERDPEGPLLSEDGGASFKRLGALAGPGPAAWLPATDPGAAPSLYCALYFEGSDRGVVVRRSPTGELRTVLDIAAERRRRKIPPRGDAEGDNRILMLLARRGARGERVYAATGAGLFRLDIDDASVE